MERQYQVVRKKQLSLPGSEQDVLMCDTDDQERVGGQTRGQAPDSDGVAYFPQETQAASGEIVPVRIVATADYDLHVNRLPSPLASRANR